MPSSSIVYRRLIGAFCMAAALPSLAACGKSGGGGNSTVAMKDMEVVDGTTSDAMTDLDGVKAEGTAMAPVISSNSAAPKVASAPAANSAAPADQGAEVVSDQ